MEHEGTKKEEAEIWLQTNYSLCLPADTQIEHVGQVSGGILLIHDVITGNKHTVQESGGSMCLINV